MNQFLGWSFPAGRVSGIPIRVHWTLLALSAFWVLSETTPRAMGWELAVCAVLWVTVLIHELGHAFAARGVGGEARQILLWPLGGLAYTDHPNTLKDDIKVVLGGPLTHIPLALLFARLLVFLGVPWRWDYLNPIGAWPDLGGGFWTYLCFYGLKIQVALLVFNLFVPVYPLDGGRILADLLLFRFSRRRVAQVIMVCSSVVALVLLSMGRIFIAIWVLFEVYQMGRLYQQDALRQHPLFGRLPDGASSPSSRRVGGGRLRLVPKSKNKGKDVSDSPGVVSPGVECPGCGRTLPAAAKMCGFCEKLLPGH